MFNWVVIAYPTTNKEKQICMKTLGKICLESDVNVFVFMFGPNVNSNIEMFQINIEGVHALGHLHSQNHNDDKYHKYDVLFDEIIIKLKPYKKIHGVVYYGHSSGIILGLWKGQKILTTVTTFVEKILIPLQPSILIFDSCYMGTISALFELSTVKSLQYVLASPYYHPGFSVLETISFGKMTGIDKILLQNITLEFQHLKGPRYRCFLLFEIRKIPKLVSSLFQAITNHELIFNNKSVVNKLEGLYDLYTSAQTSSLKKQILNVSMLSHGVNRCNKIKGITIDIALPGSHLTVYKEMLWFQKMEDIMYK